MTERMSATDVSFLHREGRTTPQHVGGIAVFEMPPDGFDYDRLVQLLEERISLVPRYRQKVRAVPGHLANPVWVDDPAFDITYHVRRSALPRPGTDAQLVEFAARIQSRPLDRNRPLWEMYLLEGLSGDRLAIITKTHSAMVDGVGTVDITQVILDQAPQPRRTVEPVWMPEPEPSGGALVAGAVVDVLRRPTAVLDVARLGAKDVRGFVGKLGSGATGVLASAATLVRHSAPAPLSATIGEQRRLAIARTRLDDYRQVRRAHGGTVNDVVLATVASALRQWLLSRDVTIQPGRTVRALAPVSVADSGDVYDSRVTALLVDLPVGEADPLRRLDQVRAATASHLASGRSVAADALVELSGFTPPTMHALGARAAHSLTRRLFDLVVTNVPGPQTPLYAAGARLLEMFPIVPLNTGQPLSIGLTSYDGGVYYGLNADRDAVPDVRTIAGLIEESLAELVALSPEVDEPVPLATSRSARRQRRTTRAGQTDSRTPTEPQR